MDPWQGQFFGNVSYRGPTESFLAGIAPLAGHADDLDALVAATLGVCETVNPPLYATHARLLCACGLRTRARPGDQQRAAELLADAMAIDVRIGSDLTRNAAANFPALRT